MIIESECHVNDITKQDFDPETLTVQWTHASCGISTVYSLPGNPIDFINRIMRHPRPKGDRQTKEAFVLFSDVGYRSDNRYLSKGHRIAAFLKDNPVFGTVVETPVRRNPNTGSFIQAWLWAPETSLAAYSKLAELLKRASNSVTNP